MPYMSIGNVIYKKLPNGKRGKKVGTAKNATVAEYMRALYANTKGK